EFNDLPVGEDLHSQSGPPASAWFSLHLKFSGSAATALARRLAVSAQNFRASSSVRPWLSMRSISPQGSVAPAMNRIRCRTIETSPHHSSHPSMACNRRQASSSTFSGASFKLASVKITSTYDPSFTRGALEVGGCFSPSFNPLRWGTCALLMNRPTYVFSRPPETGAFPHPCRSDLSPIGESSRSRSYPASGPGPWTRRRHPYSPRKTNGSWTSSPS